MYEYQINNLSVKTGDIICTVDGGEEFISGQFWRLVGKMIPGAVDHIAIYLGPDGRCIEAGPKGVVLFDIIDGRWETSKMKEARGGLLDELYGIAYPLGNGDRTEKEELEIREAVAAYCLAQVGKPYNMMIFDSETEDSFYCSHLAYKAYLPHGIDLNSGECVADFWVTRSIIFPQEIWNGCKHIRDEAL